MKQSRLTQNKINTLRTALCFLEAEVLENQNYSMVDAQTHTQARKILDDARRWLNYQETKRQVADNVAQ